MAESKYIAAWDIIRAYGAERSTSADTQATVLVLDRMGAFSSSEREVLREAGWFDD